MQHLFSLAARAAPARCFTGLPVGLPGAARARTPAWLAAAGCGASGATCPAPAPGFN